MLWAFAREGGLPFSNYIAHVSNIDLLFPASTTSLRHTALSTESIIPASVSLYLIEKPPGRPSHIPATMGHRHNNHHQPTPRTDQHWLLGRFRRLHLPHHSRLLLILHPCCERLVAQAAHDSHKRHTVGTFPAWTSWRTSDYCCDCLVRPSILLQFLADRQEDGCGVNELLHSYLWGDGDFQPPLLAFVWQETL